MRCEPEGSSFQVSAAVRGCADFRFEAAKQRVTTRCGPIPTQVIPAYLLYYLRFAERLKICVFAQEIHTEASYHDI